MLLRHPILLALSFCAFAGATSLAALAPPGGGLRGTQLLPADDATGGDFFFEPYRENYFLFFQKPVKFQFSIVMPLLTTRATNGTVDAGLFLAYTQKSLWDLYAWDDSCPFLESNYNPELFWRILAPAGSRIRWYQFGLTHESNGLGRENADRSHSWNRVFAELAWEPVPGRLRIIPALWVPFMIEDNSDIARYLGFGQIRLEWLLPLGTVQARTSLTVRKGWHARLGRGSIEINQSLGPLAGGRGGIGMPFSILAQFTIGYGETLEQYRHAHATARLGIGLFI